MDERPQLTRDRKKYTYYPHTSAVPGEGLRSRLEPSAQHHGATGDPQGRSRGSDRGDGFGLGGLRLCLFRTRSCTTHTTTSGPRSLSSPRTWTSRKEEWRCGSNSSRRASPTSRRAKGAPGNTQLYINGKLVKEGKMPVTIPLAFGLGGGFVVGRGTGFPDHFPIQESVRVHRHDTRRRDRRFGGPDCR